MINAVLVKHLFESENGEERYDMEFYTEVADMLRNDIREYVTILQCTRSIYSTVQNVNGLAKLLRMIVSEGNACLQACNRIIKIYEDEVFDNVQFERNMEIIRAFDVNEYLYPNPNADG